MERPPHPKHDRGLLTLRLTALIGLVIAGYLLYLAMTGQTAPGCGEGAGGCSKVLASRWSKLLGVPVSAPAVGVYLVVLAVSIHAGPSSPQRHREGAWRLLGVLGVAAGLSALWFIALQLFVLQGLCFYCMSAHACSLVIAAVAVTRSVGTIKWIGALPIAAMIALQLSVAPPAPTLQTGTGTMFTGFDPRNSPVLGDPDAPNVMALLFDYNCGFCREAHRLTAQAVERYGGQLVVVMLPTAIDPGCNHGAQSPGPHSETSCELARLALGVWAADPEQFDEFDRQLVERIEARGTGGAVPIDVVEGAYRRLAEQRVGADALESARNDPRIQQQLELAGQVYELAVFPPPDGRRGVPRLIIAGRAYPGLVDAEDFFELLEKAYPGLTPTSAGDR